MKIYVVQNQEGKFFRTIGYGGFGSNWVVELERAKFYMKLGQARSRITYFFKRYPQYGCPKLISWELDENKCEVIDMEAETQKAILKLKKREVQKQISHLKYQIKISYGIKEIKEKEIEELKNQLKEIV